MEVSKNKTAIVYDSPQDVLNAVNAGNQKTTFINHTSTRMYFATGDREDLPEIESGYGWYECTCKELQTIIDCSFKLKS